MMLRVNGWIRSKFAVAAALGLTACAAFSAEHGEEYAKEIQPILNKHCVECHGPDKQKGDLNFEVFADYASVVEHREIWQKVLEQIQAFEMPPKGKRELDFNTHGKLLRWLRRLPKPEKADCDQIASDRTANFYRGYVMSRRLNRAEYINTLRDLLGVPVDGLEELLPADGGGGEGFDTAGNALFTSSIHIEKYLEAAQRALDRALPDKARRLTPEQKRARAQILFAQPARKLPAREAARQVTTAFARKAFRRPVAPEEVERLLSLYDRAAERGDGFVSSVKLALKGVLISPHFLFLAEPEPESFGVHQLGGVPLASKLSYFLWASMPDEELLGLAESGDLLKEDVYRAQIYRMLADPKAEALGERFALQWLDLERLGTEVKPDPVKFPEFDPNLNEAMRAEVVKYFNFIVRSNRSLVELIDSDYTFANERLARIYGVTAPGETMQKVSFTDRNRGGVVGMAAVHALTSYPTRTSPVLRGRWVMEALLGEKVKPPPPDVPALEESAKDAANLSLREQLKLHRDKPDCAACHNKMDPLGFGMENFDVLGRWRETDRGLPIDAEGTLPSGKTFIGPAGLKDVLLNRKDDVMKHLVRKMTGYAFGRELNRFDDCVVDRTLETLQRNDYRAAVMIEHIAMSFPFRHRFYPKPDEPKK